MLSENSEPLSNTIKAEDNPSGEVAKSFAQNTFPETPLEEDSPRRENECHEQFRDQVKEAESLELKITAIEAQIDEHTNETANRLGPLQVDLIITGFRAMKLVREGKVPPEVVAKYAQDAGIKYHQNEKIAGSRLMRAIVVKNADTGSVAEKRKLRRATTAAGAINFALETGLNEVEFRAELEAGPRKVGQRHGLEYLAAKGRKLRGSKRPKASPPTVDDMPYAITGDFGVLQHGVYLMFVRIGEDDPAMARCAVVDIDNDLHDRVLAADAKSRKARSANSDGQAK